MHVNIDILKSAFIRSWSQQTSYPGTKSHWKSNNPAYGQCAVTSLIVQDIFGGKIIYNRDFHHYWNVLGDGTVIDLTREQFNDQFKIDQTEESNRQYVLASPAAIKAKTPERYLILKEKVQQLLFIESEK